MEEVGSLSPVTINSRTTAIGECFTRRSVSPHFLFAFYRDAILVGAGNALTSFYAGFVIFSVLGYMAYVKDVPVDIVTAQGREGFSIHYM